MTFWHKIFCVYYLFIYLFINNFIYVLLFVKYVVGDGEPLVDAQATAAVAHAQLPSATIAMSRPPPLLPPASARVRALGSLAGRTVER
jgi:hypothetical protein